MGILEFNPQHASGGYIQITDPSLEGIMDEVYQVLAQEIEERVPLEYRHRIKITLHDKIPHPSDPLAQKTTVDWRYIP